jgi:rfaE bifunctional protein kinase chain/domain
VNCAELLAGFRGLRTLVVGDVCLDRWCRYDPALALPSAETGIPRIGVVATEVTPGAAGTVANNLAALGAGRVGVLGIVGDDGYGFELKAAMTARGISTDLLVEARGVPTFTYTKLLNTETGEEDLPRVDFINVHPLPAALEREVADRVEREAPSYDVVIVSDQAETSQGGVVTPIVREAVLRVAAAHPEIVVWVDSRRRAELFRGVIVKPNRGEAAEASLRALGRVDFPELRRQIAAPLLIVTHGGDGAEILSEGGEQWVAAQPVEHPVDICGAGDSFSAGAAMALKVCGDAATAARFGNLVASITILKKGTGTASPAEVLARSQAG